MTNILYKNVNGTRIQMTEQEVLDLEESRVRCALKEVARKEAENAMNDVFDSMCVKLGLTDEEKEILQNGLGLRH